MGAGAQDGGAELCSPCALFAGDGRQEGKAEELVSPSAIAVFNPVAGLFSHVSVSLSVPSIPQQGGRW